MNIEDASRPATLCMGPEPPGWPSPANWSSAYLLFTLSIVLLVIPPTSFPKLIPDLSLQIGMIHPTGIEGRKTYLGQIIYLAIQNHPAIILCIMFLNLRIWYQPLASSLYRRWFSGCFEVVMGCEIDRQSGSELLISSYPSLIGGTFRHILSDLL